MFTNKWSWRNGQIRSIWIYTSRCVIDIIFWYLPDENGTTVRRKYNVKILMSFERRNLGKVSQNLLKRLNSKRACSFKRAVWLFQLLTNCPFGDSENHQNWFLFPKCQRYDYASHGESGTPDLKTTSHSLPVTPGCKLI